VQVRAYGSTAVVIGQVKVALVSGGQPKDMVLRFLDVWAKRAGKWQMVAWQSTKLP
jgi:ketosteroid isomerase-like protein